MRIRDLSCPRVVVVDLGFGDAGKGTITDWLVRELPGSHIVRFNGGAQAGHNVVTRGGRHHTFSQLGAGSFVPGTRTFLSKHVVFHPTALLVEASHLARVGVSDALDRVVVSEECLVTTPIHQAATCIRELARGDGRHGSCGVGVGETMRDAIEAPEEAIRAVDLRDAAHLRRRLERQREKKRAELTEELRLVPGGGLGDAQRIALDDPRIIDAWVDRTREVVVRGIIEDDAPLRHLLRSSRPVVFEGAQGVLLDEWHGFHPFTTWSTCTFDNAVALIEEHGSRGDVLRLGVLRAFATRHGAGPFPSESADVPCGSTPEHNSTGPWQGAFRTGWLDAVLARYAVAACRGVDGLALTHLDRFEHGEPWRFAAEYDHAGAPVTALPLGAPHDLAHVETLGQVLFACHPRYESLDRRAATTRDIVLAVEAILGVQVVVTSRGPTADEKEEKVGALSMKSKKLELACTTPVR